MGREIDYSRYKWYAVHTKYRSEKYVADALSRKGVECFLPLLKVTKKYASKVKEYDVPMISNYVFVCIDQSERIKVLQTEYVYKFLQIGSQDCSIPQSEIEIMKRVVGSNQDITAESWSYSVGDEVEIVGGQLTGLSGLLVEQEGKQRFKVELKTIGYQLMLTVKASQLRKKNKTAVTA